MQKQQKSLLKIKKKCQELVQKNQHFLNLTEQSIFETVQYKKWYKNLQENHKIYEKCVKKIIIFLVKMQEKPEEIDKKQEMEFYKTCETDLFMEQPITHFTYAQLNQTKKLFPMFIKSDKIPQNQPQLNEQNKINTNNQLNTDPNDYANNLSLNKKIIDMKNQINKQRINLKDKNTNTIKNHKNVLSQFCKKQQQSPASSNIMQNSLQKSEVKHVEMKIGEIDFHFEISSSQVIRIISCDPLPFSNQIKTGKACLRCPSKILKDPLSCFIGLGIECRKKQYENLFKKFKLI